MRIWLRGTLSSNLLTIMALKRSILVLASVLGVVTVSSAQSQAALDRILQRYTPEQVQELQDRAHYRYVGLLVFYAESFMVKEDGVFRTPTEAEIASVDLDQYNGARAEVEDVVVFDSVLGVDILLRSRVHLEQLLLSRLDADDRAAYHALRTHGQADGKTSR